MIFDRRLPGVRLLVIGIVALVHGVVAGETYLDNDKILVIDGKKVFPIGFTMPPPLNGKAPNGKNAIKELADAGATFLRTGPMGNAWKEEDLREAKKCLDVAAKNKMHVWVNLRENSSIEDKYPEREEMLRRIVKLCKDHRGMGTYKGEDEPEWGKAPVEPMITAHRIVHEIDPHHPIVIIHAPRGTFESLQRYNPTADIVGTDIYPIGYPPGAHSGTTNKELSMVGDYAQLMVKLADGKKGVWMTLQVAWSGVTNPGKTLRFPTFHEQRFMVYDAIINGARGLMFFGGSIPAGWNAEDRKLGWNWRYWNQVQRRVVEEIGSKSPIHPALVAPDSKIPITVNNKQIEICVREVGKEIFVFAAKKTKDSTIQVEFSGVPTTDGKYELLFEEPRNVQVKDGKFTDWFAPYEVHVYRFPRK